MKIYRLVGLFLVISSALTSCVKEDNSITLPEKGEAVYTSVDMGEDYEYQLFYDFQSGSVVYKSVINSWELAFQASADGKVLFMNGGADVFAYNTGLKDMKDVITTPNISKEEWGYDASCGLADSAYIKNWDDGTGKSMNDVYVLKLSPTLFPDTFKKIQLVSVDANKYVLRYGDLHSKDFKEITIPKDDNYNYSYFTFSGGGEIVNPEPHKDSWDIVFTRYRYIYHDLGNFPYLVSGVLTNPYKTSTYQDSTIGFAKIDESAINQNYSDHRDIIGYDWKYYDIDKGFYSVDSKKAYIIKNRNGQYWKLHFLDFYSSTGLKGSPSFEFQRLQ